MIEINNEGVFFCPSLKNNYDKFIYAEWVGGLKSEFNIKEVTKNKLVGKNQFVEIEITSDQLTFEQIFLEFKGDKDYLFNKYQSDRCHVKEGHTDNRYKLPNIINDYWRRERLLGKRDTNMKDVNIATCPNCDYLLTYHSNFHGYVCKNCNESYPAPVIEEE